MIQLMGLSMAQCMMLSMGQMTLKKALTQMPPFEWRGDVIRRCLKNLWLCVSVASFIVCGVLWVYILCRFPFGIAYPMVSMSYIFTMFFAMLFLHERVSVSRWIGVGLITIGCLLLSYN